jgi:hypothetical protein
MTALDLHFSAVVPTAEQHLALRHFQSRAMALYQLTKDIHDALCPRFSVLNRAK